MGAGQRTGGSCPGAPLSCGKCHHCRAQFPRYDTVRIITTERCLGHSTGFFPGVLCNRDSCYCYYFREPLVQLHGLLTTLEWEAVLLL